VRVRFGDFVVDTDRRELLRDNDRVDLRPKAFDVLRILIENRPKAMSHEELYDALWPNTFVEKTNLHKLMHELRNALDDRDQTIICTVYGFGFRFGASAFEESAAAPRWQIIIGDREFDLRDGENIVGRGRDAVVRVDAPSISRHHARITISGDSARLEDLGSKNGTCVCGKRVRSQTLSNGDAILFGTIAASFRAAPADRSTESVE